jgi:hypothetical protein
MRAIPRAIRTITLSASAAVAAYALDRLLPAIAVAAIAFAHELAPERASAEIKRRAAQ